MEIIQWIAAAGTAVFVALVGYFQWRTAEHKAVLDLFDRRHEIYLVVRKSVGQICTSSQGFDQERELEFLAAMERAYFFFGDDINIYLKQLWSDIVRVLSVDRGVPPAEGRDPKAIEARYAAFNRVAAFYTVGQPLFARYMRFPQTVPQPWQRGLMDLKDRGAWVSNNFWFALLIALFIWSAGFLVLVALRT